MQHPSIGRSNHDVGYLRGNFAWQEWAENKAEVANRKKNSSFPKEKDKSK